jgi:hypothetical protein
MQRSAVVQSIELFSPLFNSDQSRIVIPNAKIVGRSCRTTGKICQLDLGR